MIEKQIIINHSPAETRIAVVERDQVAELMIERHADRGLVGNIYKGSVIRVLPGMQSAFIDIGEIRSAFLHASDTLSEDFLEQTKLYLAQSGDEVLLEDLERKRKWAKHSIESVLRDGQAIMVQVAKEPIGQKGARLSMFINLPGRYLVLSPHFDHVGISKKIDETSEKVRLREAVSKAKPQNMAVIVRTAAKGVPEETLINELNYLVGIWNDVLSKFAGASAPSLIHRDLDLAQRIIREQFSEDVGKIVVDNEGLHDRILRFVRATMPASASKIEVYQGSSPIFDIYGIEMDIERALSKKVDLPSGGYIVIDQTEALTTFDVNTGSYTGRGGTSDAGRRTNLEAVKKIAAQLRLRNIGGIIVIDFIDMDSPGDREQVYNALLEELKNDKARTNVLKISELGLVQMTRKRVSDSLEHALMDECPLCMGRGKIKSVQTEAHDLLREIVRVHHLTGRSLLHVRVREDIRDWILEEERDWFQEIVDRWGLTVNFRPGELTLAALHENAYEVRAE